MTSMYNRGFTLIELLVVIAIIGILSSVVLASLNTARGKGADATIKSSLNNMRSQAELFYTNTNETYGTTFAEANCPVAAGGTTIFGDAQMVKGINSAFQASGGTAGNAICSSTASAYAIAVKLVNVATSAWCVDSTGNSKQYNYGAGTVGNAITASACN